MPFASDHDGELRLGVDVLDAGTDDDVVVGAGERARRLREEDRMLRRLLLLLEGVVRGSSGRGRRSCSDSGSARWRRVPLRGRKCDRSISDALSARFWTSGRRPRRKSSSIVTGAQCRAELTSRIMSPMTTPARLPVFSNETSFMPLPFGAGAPAQRLDAFHELAAPR